jgi:hypothetical protein
MARKEDARNMQTITGGTFMDSGQLGSGTRAGRITIKKILGRQILFRVAGE